MNNRILLGLILLGLILAGYALVVRGEGISPALDALFMPVRVSLLPDEPDQPLAVPVEGIVRSQIAQTYGSDRSGGRSHEGVDIFAPRNTPVIAAAPGYVFWSAENQGLGGNWVMVAGAGGRYYYYAHLEDFAPGLYVGKRLEAGDPIGLVGDSGNAKGTPTHLHFGVYEASCLFCPRQAQDPWPLLLS